jgi:hypothetical protein
MLGISVFFSNKFCYFFKKNIWNFFHNINVTNFSNSEGENAKLSIAQKKLWDSWYKKLNEKII